MPKRSDYQSFSERLMMLAVMQIGRPYEDKGQADQFDCSQFVLVTLRAMGFNIPDMTASDMFDRLFTLNSQPEVGPIVGAMFRREKGKIVHIGLLGPSGDTVIHNTLQDGRVVLKSLENVRHTDIRFLECRALMSYLAEIRFAPNQAGGGVK